MTVTNDKAPDIVERYIDDVRERAPTIADVMQAAANHKTRAELHDEIDKLQREIARLKSDRLYIVGCNDGYDAAMDQAAQFCEASEARWREESDKAHEHDHEDAERQSADAFSKAEAGGFLASVVRGAVAIPLIRGVGLCMLDGEHAESAVAEIADLRQQLAEARERNLLANERADNAVADLDKVRDKALEESLDAVKSSNAPENIRGMEFVAMGPLGILSRACAAIRALKAGDVQR